MDKSKYFRKLFAAVALLACSASIGFGQITEKKKVNAEKQTNDAAQSNDSLKKHIREFFQEINNNKTLKKVELDNDEFTGEAADGGTSLTGYVKGDAIYKMSVWIGVSYCVREFDYYFYPNGKLFFIYETEKDFPETKDGGLDHEKLNLVFEGRYYFNDGKKIDIKTKGKKRFDEKPVSQWIQSLLDDTKLYKGLITAKLKKAK